MSTDNIHRVAGLPRIVIDYVRSMREVAAEKKEISHLRSLVIGLRNMINMALEAVESKDIIALNFPNALEIAIDRLLIDLQQIENSQTIERAKHYIERLFKGLTEKKDNSVNDINMNRWKDYTDIRTDSLWLLDRDNSGAHNAGYWGNFVPEIPRQMIQRYTKEGDWVLDVFAGSGTTLIEANRLKRNSIGLDLNEEVVRNTINLLKKEPENDEIYRGIYQGDACIIDYSRELHYTGVRTVQLVIMHPPYADIIKFSDNPRDLSNADSTERFLDMLAAATKNAATILDKGRYLVLVIADKYEDGEIIPLGSLAMNTVINCGFALKSIIVKNIENTIGKRGQEELWRYRALQGGFNVFKHEYIYVFKKK